jgi:hypothetical protein
MALIACPSCSNQVSDQAAACPKCGHPLRAPPKPPVQAAAVQPKKKTGCLTYLLVGIGALIGIGMCSSAINGGSHRSAATATAATTPPASASGNPASAPAQQAAASPPIKESCAELAKSFGPGSKLSDLQKDELWKTFQGREFSWDLQVTEVSAGAFGGITVQFKCARNSPSLIQDLQMEFPDEAKSEALKLEKDHAYKVRGRLKHTSTLLGMTAEPL